MALPLSARSTPCTASTSLRILSAVVVGVLAAGPPASAADDLHRKRRQTSSQVRAAQAGSYEASAALQRVTAKLGSVRKQARGAQRAVEVARSRLATQARIAQSAAQRLEDTRTDLATARERVSRAQLMLSQKRAQIGVLAATNYAQGDPALLGLSSVLGSSSTEEVATRLNTVSTLMARETSAWAGLRSRESSAREERARAARLVTATAVRSRQAESALRVRGTAERAASLAASRVSTLLRQQQALQTMAARALRSDRAQLARLELQDEALQRLIFRRAARKLGVDRARLLRSANRARAARTDAGRLNAPFSAPVPGWITSPFGWRTHPIFGYRSLHDGDDFHAPCGSPVAAIGEGTVIARVWSGVYGNRMYVDLGRVDGRVATGIYNHLGTYRASIGERVRRGHTIATAGNSGWSTGCHLHFTLLLDGAAVDPARYF